MTNIYVGNLDFATTEDQLRTLFAAHGAVETVTIVADRDTGQPRGLAFVEMTSDGEAQDAIRALNGSVHGGRALIVNEARPKLHRNRDGEDAGGEASPGSTQSRSSASKGIAKCNASISFRRRTISNSFSRKTRFTSFMIHPQRGNVTTDDSIRGAF
jgi:cold-inducible RNA-binding protein